MRQGCFHDFYIALGYVLARLYLYLGFDKDTWASKYAKGGPYETDKRPTPTPTAREAVKHKYKPPSFAKMGLRLLSASRVLSSEDVGKHFSNYFL